MEQFFNYGNSGFEVRDGIINAHQESWKTIPNTGSFWAGEDHVQIAQQARSARLQRRELPFNRSHPSCSLSNGALEGTYTIAADAHKIDKQWADNQIAKLGSGA